jgi:uncharacterized protein
MNDYRKALSAMRSIPEVREILEHELFRSMILYRHHGSVSCLEHSLKVASIAFTMAKNRKVDLVSTVRAALLHDFYLYDWHTDSPGLHGFRHPYTALKNAREHFTINPVEKEAIVRHMWPLTPIAPRSREAMIVTIADKAAPWGDYSRSARSILKVNFRKANLKPHA